jgi:hypothetical protein
MRATGSHPFDSDRTQYGHGLGGGAADGGGWGCGRGGLVGRGGPVRRAFGHAVGYGEGSSAKTAFSFGYATKTMLRDRFSKTP